MYTCGILHIVLLLYIILLDIRCRNLSSPSVEDLFCSSGSIGVGYEGDNCSFTCNTGYELTGSDTRTCQSNGSWNGSDDVCRRGTLAICKNVSNLSLYFFYDVVRCASLSDPSNGTIICSFGDDGVPSYEDTCNFTCNTGYELTGTRSFDKYAYQHINHS